VIERRARSLDPSVGGRGLQTRRWRAWSLDPPVEGVVFRPAACVIIRISAGPLLMTVSSHLHIRLEEYDARIRTFIPRYEELLDAAAQSLRALDTGSPHLVDLGTGTGALASRCVGVLPHATLTAIDEDPDILALARKRLSDHIEASFVEGSFVHRALPRCDAIVASLALHHVRTAAAKRELYERCRAALSPRGLLISADCHPSADERLATLERDAWRAHLLQSYSAQETTSYFDAWAAEDVYFVLPDELELLRASGFAPDVVWRQGCFAVICARAK
jgi:ubiquinone/menaquinone biosynthesis C-methylase UbiE